MNEFEILSNLNYYKYFIKTYDDLEPLIEYIKKVYKLLYGDFKSFTLDVYNLDYRSIYPRVVIFIEYKKVMGTSIRYTKKYYSEASYKNIMKSIIRDDNILVYYMFTKGIILKNYNKFDSIINLFENIGMECTINKEKTHTTLVMKNKRLKRRNKNV